MKAPGYAALGLLTYLGYRLIDLGIATAKTAAALAIACGVWFLIDASSATARLSALWSVIRG